MSSKATTLAGRAAPVWAAFPAIAYAANETLLHTDPQTLPWYTWALVVVLSIMGWFASSAPTLAGWIDDGNGASARELWTRRWGIIGRLATCLVAGMACFFGGLAIGTPMVANFLAVLFASYGGDKYLQFQAERTAARNPPGGP